MRRPFLATLALLTLLLGTPLATAGTAEDPEITDPAGDAEHIEFKHQEPTLDVTAVYFGWTGDQLTVTLEIPSASAFGPSQTTDALDEGTYYDVYWTMDGQDHVARVVFDAADEPSFYAGQSMQIERQLMWEEGDDIHGDLVTQSGEVQTGEPARLAVNVDPSVIGDPGPGSVLEAPAFSTYVDHHPPASGPEPLGPHHPGHVDENDEPGRAYTVAQDTPTDPDSQEAANGATDDIPFPGLALLAVMGTLALTRRR